MEQSAQPSDESIEFSLALELIKNEINYSKELIILLEEIGLKE